MPFRPSSSSSGYSCCRCRYCSSSPSQPLKTSAGAPWPPSSAVAFVLALTLQVRLMFMSVTLVRYPMGRASSHIMEVVTSVFLRGNLLPSLTVITMLCPPPATGLLIFLSRICA